MSLYALYDPHDRAVLCGSDRPPGVDPAAWFRRPFRDRRFPCGLGPGEPLPPRVVRYNELAARSELKEALASGDEAFRGMVVYRVSPAYSDPGRPQYLAGYAFGGIDLAPRVEPAPDLPYPARPGGVVAASPRVPAWIASVFASRYSVEFLEGGRVVASVPVYARSDPAAVLLAYEASGITDFFRGRVDREVRVRLGDV